MLINPRRNRSPANSRKRIQKRAQRTAKDPQTQTPAKIARPSRKGRMIVVSGNYQSVAVAAGLQLCFAEDTVIPVMFPISADAATMADLTARLEQADIWVSQ